MTDTTTETSRAEVARSAAQDTAQEAASQGQAVAATAVEQAKEVASVATEQAATVGNQALGQARTLLDSASGDVRDQLEQRLRTLSEQARTTAEELQALVDGRPEDAGRTKELAQSASGHIGRLADKADELGVQGVVEEVTDLARRRPVLFLAGAATAGILVGRMARAGKESQGQPDPEPVAVAPVAAPTPVFDPAPLPPPVSGGTTAGWVES